MNKIEKILVIVAFAIIIVLSLIGSTFAGTEYNAGNYQVGSQLSINYSDYNGSNSLFCIEHNQSLHKNKVTYQVVSRISINGNTSRDQNGNTQSNLLNGQLAYLINGTRSGYSLSTVRQSIWHMITTWVKQVGRNHAGISEGIISGNKTAGKTDLNTAAENYANSVSNAQATDNTNKSAIKVVSEIHDGVTYVKVGPFNWSYPGTLTGTTVFDQNRGAINGVKYITYNGTSANWSDNTGIIRSGADFYVAVPNDGKVTAITGIKGYFTKEVITAEIAFLESVSGAKWQNLMIANPGTGTENVENTFEYNIPMLGDLEIEKVNEDNHSVKLAGVGFIIQNKETGKYVFQDGITKEISYVSKEEATEFITDKNGKIHIENLVVGTYIAYETTLGGNYGYELIEGGQTISLSAGQVNIAVIGNKQIYVKLSGFVWVDKISEKQSIRNDLYKDNDYDVNDILLDGITVRLKDKTTGETIKEAKTADGGAYLFIDVLVEKLGDYYIEFEYDGLTYTNVIPHLENEENGSKSAENATVRDEFNKNFSVVEGKTESTGITRDSNGNEKHTLNYNIDQNAHTATLINNGQYTITANTNETGYSIKENFTPGQEEIKYINLGLYEREQPDIALKKDLENVNVAVNGYNHIYQYSQRFVNQGEYGDGFNIGVKFGNKYGAMSYTRAIYKADYEYINENDKSKELKVYVTYKLGMKNESTNLIVQVNNIVDYFDSRYSIVKVGTGIDQNGNITGDINRQDATYNNEYSKTTIYTNTRIDAQKEEAIYVQFELNREAVLNILNNGENLENVAEINSYSVFDGNGKVYAGIDRDSNPGNAVPDNKATYEDDTDSSPALKLEVADAREMTGKVFLDSTSGELMTGQIRQGSGAYEEGELEIEGVKVTLTENTGSGKVYETTTDSNGDFLIKDYIPGDYTLTYTWGDNTYTVQNYKGTVYSKDRYDANIANKEWYKTDVDTRWTDAIDDYQTRLNIDNELKQITNSSQTTIDKMNSTTPTMGIGVEYDTTYTASTGDRYTYRIANVDFGIVERARQEIELTKRIKTFKLTLANGQVIADVEIGEDGKLNGQYQYLTYMKPTPHSNPTDGFLRMELDNELIQGATVEVTYAIKAINNSELEYLSENYYKYGIIEGDVVTITPSAVVDYLDMDWAFDANQNPDWQIKQADDLRGVVAEEIFNAPETQINNRIILYTEKLAEQKLKPTESAEVELHVSKLLSNSEDIELDNETEIVKLDKTGGSKITSSTPGNYVPGGTATESDDDRPATVIITPSTGANRAFIIPIVVAIVAVIILGVGVLFIKKKALGDK